MSEPCCGSDRKTALLISLSALLVIAVIGWVREANKPPQVVEQSVEVVGVLVAAKDLPTGTVFTKANVNELTKLGFVPKSVVSPNAKLFQSTDHLINGRYAPDPLSQKRLSRAYTKGEVLDGQDVKIAFLIGPDEDIVSLPFPVGHLAVIGRGSRCYLLASYAEGNRREVFTLLPDVQVLALNGGPDLVGRDQIPEKMMVSFSVDAREATLVALAYQLNCRVELLLRHPDAPKRDWSYEKTLTLLQSIQKQQEELKLEVAPAPRAKSVS